MDDELEKLLSKISGKDLSWLVIILCFLGADKFKDDTSENSESLLEDDELEKT